MDEFTTIEDAKRINLAYLLESEIKIKLGFSIKKNPGNTYIIMCFYNLIYKGDKFLFRESYEKCFGKGSLGRMTKGEFAMVPFGQGALRTAGYYIDVNESIIIQDLNTCKNMFNENFKSENSIFKDKNQVFNWFLKQDYSNSPMGKMVRIYLNYLRDYHGRYDDDLEDSEIFNRFSDCLVSS